MHACIDLGSNSFHLLIGEWEDGRMDRFHGATEACAFTKKVDFKPSSLAFDSAFDKENQ